MLKSVGIVIKMLLFAGKGFVIKISKFSLVTTLMEGSSAVICTAAEEPINSLLT